MNNELGVDCSGCKIKLTTENAGGYRCYCQKCVAAMPELPKDKNNEGYNLAGTYPKFKWIAA